MKRFLTSLKFTILSTIFLAGFIINSFIFRSPLAAAILLIFFGFLVIPILGRSAAPRETKNVQMLYGLFVLLSTVAIVGSIFYYLSAFTAPVAITMILFFPPLSWLIWQRIPQSEDVVAPGHNPLSGSTEKLKPLVIAAASTIILLLVVLFSIISKAATESAICSPWEVATPMFFLIFATISGLLTALSWRGCKKTIILPIFATSLFAFLAVALLVFPLGFGFDSFIHRATENHIAQYGTITPKPFYYIGQYSIILFFHYAFLLPIDWLDKIFVPLLTAILIPLAWITAAAHLLKDKKIATAILPIIFLLPLSSFIVTTPQGWDNLWFWLLILLSIPRQLDRDNQPIWPLVVGALATVLIHPIAGLPAILLIAFLAAATDPRRQKYPHLAAVFSWIIFLFGCLALPVMFVINNWKSGLAGSFDFSALSPNALIQNFHLNLFFENRFSPLLDFVYLFGWNQIILIIIAAMLGIIITARRKILTNINLSLSTLRLYIIMAVILFINYVVINSAVDFDFLIDYERGNYAARLIPLAIYCLSPFLIIFAGRIFTTLEKKPIVLKISALIFLVTLITSAFYLNYPRHDNYETGHGYNVSSSDIAAVIDVERDAAGADFVVLANQMSSAAALQEFGFKKYYGDQFYYPIPTGGALYQLFLKMNESPSRETALVAMDLIDVDRIYYLVSDYWWQAEKIIEVAKTNANNWWAIDNGEITIFEYNRQLGG